MADSTVAIADADRGYWYIGVYGFSACSYTIVASTSNGKLEYSVTAVLVDFWNLHPFQRSVLHAALTTVIVFLVLALSHANAMLATWAITARQVRPPPPSTHTHTMNIVF